MSEPRRATTRLVGRLVYPYNAFRYVILMFPVSESDQRPAEPEV